MNYKIDWCAKKKIKIGSVEKEIIEGTFMGEDGVKIEATIWREDKDGKVFPNFDTLMVGSSLVANPWTKPGTDKITLYPPKAQNAPIRGNGAVKSATIEKAQERKAENIKRAMDAKEWSIMESSTIRMAVDTALAEVEIAKIFDEGTFRMLVKKWRQFYVDTWSIEKDEKQAF